MKSIELLNCNTEVKFFRVKDLASPEISAVEFLEKTPFY